MNTVLLSFVAIAVTLLTSAHAIEKYPKTYYGYITINKTYDSAMFYAIRGNEDKKKRINQPYIIVLEGGPGKTSLYSAYLGTGPETVYDSHNLINNNHSWTKHATMVYVDNPVGTGFSYSKDPRGLPTSDKDIEDNFWTFISGFWEKHPEYKTNKMWVYGHGYGAKMAALFGRMMVRSVDMKKWRVFGGLVLASPWISPMSCMNSYAPYLRSLGQCSRNECEEIERMVGYAANAIEAGNWKEATDRFFEQKKKISEATATANWNDIRRWVDDRGTMEWCVGNFLENEFLEIPEVIKANITHKFNSQSEEVYNKLYDSYMKDSTDILNFLLSLGGVDGHVTVHIYNGEYDLHHNSDCTRSWLRRLKTYYGIHSSRKKTIFKQPGYPSKVEGFFWKYDNFEGTIKMWWVNKVGAYVAENNGYAGEFIITNVVEETDP